MYRAEFEKHPSYMDPKYFSNLTLLSHGAHCNVYSACYKDNRRVILKDFCGFDEKSFYREAQVMGQLNHKNIVNFIGVTSVQLINSTEYVQIVMELAEGGTLKDRISEEEKMPMTPMQKLLIARDIALGVEYLHSQNLIHRALVIDNILLRKDGTALVSDFRLVARLSQNKKDSYGKLDGFPRSAPETTSGDEYDESSDVYSFGMLLVELAFQKRLEALRCSYDDRGTIDIEHIDSTFPKNEGSRLLFELAKECVIAEPQKRPSFKKIASKLNHICEIYLDKKNFSELKEISLGKHSKTFMAKYCDSKTVLLKDYYNYDSDDFYRELKVVKDLKHKNVIKFLGVTSIEDMSSTNRELMVLEYIPGESLAKRFIERPLHFMDRILIAKDIAEGMNYVHSKHIVHRNLTAENVLYRDNGTALVVDFRLSSSIFDDNKENFKDIEVLRHSPPEVARGTYDFASDIYSFGMFLYEIIACKPLENLDVPYFKDGSVNVNDEKDETAFLYNIANQCVSIEPERRPSFPQVLEKIHKYKFLFNADRILKVKLLVSNELYCTYEATSKHKNFRIQSVVSKSMKVRDAFEEAVDVLKELDHRNLVKFVGVSNMKLEESQLNKNIVFNASGAFKLSSKLKGVSSLNYNEIVSIAKDVAFGMVYLHSKNVAHMNLTTDSVILLRDGTARIKDYGMAYVDVHSSTKTSSPYKCPKAVDKPIVDKRCDVYSFGILLSELICRKKISDLQIPVNDLGRINTELIRTKLPQHIEAKKLFELAQKCTSTELEERPTFQMVTLELENLAEYFLKLASKPKQELDIIPKGTVKSLKFFWNQVSAKDGDYPSSQD
ncbi:non-receptor tyrosine-protein kinase TYK2-like [Artemia franciscana]|uniref:non-receptor tyrosine-protein kinase TYK2-like n=1 Tax=Artemia franciscana TaxID=6661 RepID=UPI0032DAC051